MTNEERIAVEKLVKAARLGANFLAEKTGWPLRDLKLTVEADQVEGLMRQSSATA